MKKYISTILMLVTFVSLISAQGELSFGFKAGLNFSNMDGALEMDNQGNTIEEVTYSTGFSVGALLNYGITDIFGLRTELLYSQKGRVINFEGPSYFIFNATADKVISTGSRSLEADVINSYLEIPLLAYAKFGKFEIMGGAYASALISSTANGRMSYTPTSRQGTNFETVDFVIDYRYQRDDAGEGSGDVTALSVNGKSIDVSSTVGAYYEYSTVEKRLYNFVDLGLIGGLSFYLNEGFFVNARVEYGLLDTTDDEKDVSLSNLSNNEFVFRNDIDRNFTFHTSVGFRF